MLAATLDPRVVGSSYVFDVAGDCAGATVQSALVHLGPAGTFAGLIARPAFSYLGSVFGTAVGQNLADGKPFSGAVASSLREFSTGRDVGPVIGEPKRSKGNPPLDRV